MWYDFNMKRPRNGSTVKQYAYAHNKLSGKANSKYEVAKLSGYSNTMARRPKEKIESTDGYKNAMMQLAAQSNNMLMKVLYEFDRRDITKFADKDLIAAVNAITSSWAKIDTQRQMNANKDPDKNPLRSLFMTRADVLTVQATTPKKAKEIKPKKKTSKEIESDIKKLDLNF